VKEEQGGRKRKRPIDMRVRLDSTFEHREAKIYSHMLITSRAIQRRYRCGDTDKLRKVDEWRRNKRVEEKWRMEAGLAMLYSSAAATHTLLSSSPMT
jgi:hypothetical protein